MRINFKIIGSGLIFFLYLVSILNILSNSGKIPVLIEVTYSLSLKVLLILIIFLNLIFWIKKQRYKIDIIMLSLIFFQILSSILTKRISLEGIYNILTWPLLFLIIYKISLKKNIKLYSRLGTIIILLSSVWLVYIHRNFKLNTIYYVYYSIILLPLILVYEKNKLFKHIFFIIIFFLILWSNKRAGLVILSIVTGNYYFIEKILLKKKLKKFLNIFFSILVLILVIKLIINNVDNLIILKRFQKEFIQGLENNDRVILYKECINLIKNQNIINLIIGEGYKGVTKLLPNYAGAHNDYLEILIDYGIIGVIIIFIYISFLLKKIKIIKKYGDKEIIIYISLLTISFILSLLSFLMWQSFLMNLVAIILANAIGKAERIKKQKKIIKKSYIRLT